MPSPHDPHDALRGLLETASKVVEELAEEPLFRRLLEVFARMPEDDREPILSILEREVHGRLLGTAAEPLTSVRLRPNPRARLYARVIEPDVAVVHLDTTVAIVRAMRAFHREIASAPAMWEAQILEALRALEVDELESIARFNRLLLAQIEQCKRERTPR
jgi:hypothetical protein